MIEKINSMLESIGSNFRTEDGITITMYIGNLTFLKRSFDSITECYIYVLGIYNSLQEV